MRNATVIEMAPDLATWQTDAAGPFVTIRAGGPLEGIVTLTAIADGHGRTLVRALWKQGGHSHSGSVEAESYADARTLAQAAADALAEGRAPDLGPD